MPGCRVKVRFAGQDVDGFVVERADASDHEGRLAPLRRVVSAEPVLAPEIATLSAAIAERYAGTRSDVLRLAVPPRHATTEKQPSAPAPRALRVDVAAAAAAWSAYDAGASLVLATSPRAAPHERSGRPSRASDWPIVLAQAVAAAVAVGSRRARVRARPQGRRAGRPRR